MKTFERVALVDEAHIGLARRSVRRVAAELGMSERQIAEIDIAVKELGSNAIKFAQATGQLFVAQMDTLIDPSGVEIIYVDKGPGIEDLTNALEDGFTTAGSMGAGLGAIKRMADEFYIYSTPQSQTRRLALHGRTTHGTAVVFRKHLAAEEGSPQSKKAIWGTFTRPAIGGDASGDAYVIRRDEDHCLVAVIDGLGHGLGAREAAREAVAAILENASRPLDVIIQTTHDSLRSTRGAVAGLASIDCVKGTIEYAGIGNTDFRAFGGGGCLRFISLNGTLGSRLERVKVFKEQLPKSVVIVMSTDGVSERWDADSYPGLLGLHPELLCAVIARDYSRANDDATIMCGRLQF